MKPSAAPAVQYSTRATREVAAFLDSVTVVGDRSVSEAVANAPGIALPATLDKLLGVLSDRDSTRLLDSIGAGITHYRSEHGVAPTADVVEAAIQQAKSALHGIDAHGNVMDSVTGTSATSSTSAPTSLQPNRAVVAILSAIAEAIPFASYLPVDISSNESKLAILSHTAASDYGDYGQGAIMDGVNVGGVYASAQRMVRFELGGNSPFTSKFTAVNLADDRGFCDPAQTGVPVLRGRTTVFVNGIPVARDTAGGSTATSAISGVFSLKGVDHAMVGVVTPATGEISITGINPPLPAGSALTAEGIVDYETAPALIPVMQVLAQTYTLYANPWRIMTRLGIDSNTQLRNELGLDADSEALIAIRNQMAMERHFNALRKVEALGGNNRVAYNFDFSGQIAQKTRSQIWQDFASVIANADQQMAEDTMDHGITHLYAPSFIAAQMQSLPSELFRPSGIAARAGIYRVGRLYDKYEVYYAPFGPTQSDDLKTAKVLAVGRSSQAGRNPIVLGDAVAPTFLPLATNSDLAKQSAMYARDYTEVNPHQPSALGCAVIDVTNLN
ncbi:hypothetical protein [Ideonella sp.]|uniref:hypothetical protein n=1 Tax=Ideonella sp. TaxID=1929293 RepID=UPI0035B0267B